MLAAAPDLISVLSLQSGGIVWSSPGLMKTLGWTTLQVQAMGDDLYRLLVHPDDITQVHAADRAAGLLADGEVTHLRYRVRHADGRYRWVSRRVTPFQRDDDGNVTELLGMGRDITDSVEVEERLARGALHDPLTGLPNRTLLVDRLGGALSRHARTGEAVPVLFCDLDGFKHINDTSGHAAGDLVLVATAQRLQSALRPQDTVARVGGDEFVVVLETPPGDIDLRTEALAVADRLIAVVGQPIDVSGTGGDRGGGGVAHVVTSSIGVLFASPGMAPEEALRDADSAMYRAKARGKNRFEVFDDSFRAEAVERGRIEHALRVGLADDQDAAPSIGPAPARPAGSGLPVPGLSVVYQPVFDLAGPELIAVEALARLTDPYGVALSPGQFIPVAEETGLIGPLGQHVLDTACRDLASWHARFPGWRHLGVAVNLSARQAGLGDLVAAVHTALDRSHLAPTMLTLELTESVLLEAGRSTLTALTALHAAGVRVAIDDFGTGYASLRYLARLPVNSVKIDQSFTRGLPDDPTSATIVRTVAGLARDLNISCVVEGIETPEQLSALPAGVHGQGFLLGRPVSASHLGELLSKPIPWPDGRELPASGHRAPARAEASPRDEHNQRADDRDRRADDRDRRAGRRERQANRRDAAADERDVLAAQRDIDVDLLLALAEHRDRSAEVRDDAANQRDLHSQAREEQAGLIDPAPRADRRQSAQDRRHGAMDRDAGAGDRAELSAPRRAAAAREHAEADQATADQDTADRATAGQDTAEPDETS